jgi:hypothetical protein
VVFSSGDRGIEGNGTRSLEHGLEAAYSWMNGLATDDQPWSTTAVQIGDNNVTVSKPQGMPNVQIICLRLPDGGRTGSGYALNKRESLRKLYTGAIKTLTTMDGNGAYMLGCLKNTIMTILQKTEATDVRVLDYKTGIPDEQDEWEDHADHVVSARLVVDVMKHINSTAKIQGYATSAHAPGIRSSADTNSYAGSVARRFDANLNETGLDFKRKVAAFLAYAEHDPHMVCFRQEAVDHSSLNDHSARLTTSACAILRMTVAKDWLMTMISCMLLQHWKGNTTFSKHLVPHFRRRSRQGVKEPTMSSHLAFRATGYSFWKTMNVHEQVGRSLTLISFHSTSL